LRRITIPRTPDFFKMLAADYNPPIPEDADCDPRKAFLAA